ncbi:hypothetical protein MTO96_034146 [Rhipicephalus appendiculatus]
MSMSGLAPPPPFLPTPGRPAVAWPQWLRIFENFLLASGAPDCTPNRRKALLLHSLGVEGQRIFYTLPLPSSDHAKPDAIKALGLQIDGSTLRCLETTTLPTNVGEEQSSDQTEAQQPVQLPTELAQEYGTIFDPGLGLAKGLKFLLITPGMERGGCSDRAMLWNDPVSQKCGIPSTSRFSCSGFSYCYETSQTFDKLANYVKKHGFDGCALVDVDEGTEVDGEFHRNLSRFKCG